MKSGRTKILDNYKLDDSISDELQSICEVYEQNKETILIERYMKQGIAFKVMDTENKIAFYDEIKTNIKIIKKRELFITNAKNLFNEKNLAHIEVINQGIEVLKQLSSEAAIDSTVQVILFKIYSFFELDKIIESAATEIGMEFIRLYFAETGNIIGLIFSKFAQEIYPLLTFFPDENSLTLLSLADLKDKFTAFKNQQVDAKSQLEQLTKAMLKQIPKSKLKHLDKTEITLPEKTIAALVTLINITRKNVILYAEGYFDLNETLSADSEYVPILAKIIKVLLAKFEHSLYDTSATSTPIYDMELNAECKNLRKILIELKAQDLTIKNYANDIINKGCKAYIAKLAHTTVITLENKDQQQLTSENTLSPVTNITPLNKLKSLLINDDNIAEIRKLLKNNPIFLSHRDFFVACQKGHEKIVGFLCEKYTTNVNDFINVTIGYDTALSIAIKNNQRKIMQILITKTHATFEIRDKASQTYSVVNCATTLELKEFIQNLIRQRQEVQYSEKKDVFYKMTPSSETATSQLKSPSIPEEVKEDDVASYFSTLNSEYPRLEIEHNYLVSLYQTLAAKVGSDLIVNESDIKSLLESLQIAVQEEKSCLESAAKNTMQLTLRALKKQHLKIVKKFGHISQKIKSYTSQLNEYAAALESTTPIADEKEIAIKTINSTSSSQIQHPEPRSSAVITSSAADAFFSFRISVNGSNFRASQFSIIADLLAEQTILSDITIEYIRKSMLVYALFFIIENLMEYHSTVEMIFYNLSQADARLIRNTIVNSNSLIPNSLINNAHLFDTLYEKIVDFSKSLLDKHHIQSLFSQSVLCQEIIADAHLLKTAQKLSFGERMKNTLKLLKLQLLFKKDFSGQSFNAGEQLKKAALAMINIRLDKFALQGASNHKKAVSDRHLIQIKKADSTPF